MDFPKPTIIKVVGLGGGGSNAVNRMIDLDVEGVEYIAANTDAQALAQSRATVRLQLGPELTKGLGAGGRPERGEAAAEESQEAIKAALRGADMVFLTAGMGGGTGTGAIPVVAAVAQSLGILTVAVVSTPFTFEATQRQRNAENGLAKLRNTVDTLITVPNDKLLAILPRSTTFDVALRVADEVLRQGVQGIIELISRPGLMNVDFSNVKALMKQAGSALMAIGHGRGENKALDAARQALKMPLLDIKSLEQASGLLLHFTGGEDLSLHEVNQAVSEISQAAPNADVVVGATIDAVWTGRAQAILIVTGVDNRRPLEEIITAGSQMVIQPRSHSAAPASQLQRGAPHFVVAQPAAPVADQTQHLAEAFFNQAIAEANPAQAARVAATTYVPDTNNLDVPAFLRKRTSLRDFEGRR
jgi:cell division protein FtsZ